MSIPKIRFKDKEGLEFPSWELSSIENFVEKIHSGRSKKNKTGCFDLYGATGLIGRSDSFDCNGEFVLAARVGSIGVLNLPSGKYAVSDNTLIFEHNELTTPQFLYYRLSLFDWYSVATGTSQKVVSAGRLKKSKLFWCSLDEQQKIASFFSTLDQKIELNEQKLEALEKLKKGIGRRLLMKDPESQLKNSHWKTVRISEVADLITGFPFNSSDFSSSGIRLIKGANIKRGTLSFDQKTSSFWPSDAGLTKYALETGDLLVQMDGALVGESFGRVTEDLLPALLVQRVTRIRATEDIIEIIYQIFCIGDFLKFVQSVKTTTAIPHISLQNIKDFEISIPEDVNELHRLASFFRSLDAKINLVRRKKELYTYLKSGFLQQMFI